MLFGVYICTGLSLPGDCWLPLPIYWLSFRSSQYHILLEIHNEVLGRSQAEQPQIDRRLGWNPGDPGQLSRFWEYLCLSPTFFLRSLKNYKTQFKFKYIYKLNFAISYITICWRFVSHWIVKNFSLAYNLEDIHDPRMIFLMLNNTKKYYVWF